MTVVFDQSAGLAGTDDGNTNGNATTRQLIVPAFLSAGPVSAIGTVTFLFGTAEPAEANCVTHVYIGQASATSGVSSFTGNQVQVFFGGSQSFSGSAAGVVTSDQFTLGENWDPTKAYLVSIFCIAGKNVNFSNLTGLTGCTIYGAGGSDVSSQTAPGLGVFGSNQLVFVQKITIIAPASVAQPPLYFPTRNIFKPPFRPPFGLRNLVAPPSTVASTISPDGGSYAFTGATAGLGDTLPLAGGSYAYSGTAATFTRGIGLTLGAGAYSFTGTALTPAVGLPAAGGSYAYTGTAITPAVGMPLGGGSYVFTGTAVTLAKSGGQQLFPAGGTYSFSGTAATLGAGLPLGGGSYAFNGASATPGVGLTIPGGAYNFSGTVAAFAAHLSLLVPGGSYLFTGSGGTSLTYAPAGTGGAPPVHALTFLADIGSWSPP